MSSDFDFLHGAWTVHHRRLRDVTDPAETEWIEFAARSTCEPVLRGGNVERMYVTDSPIGAFEGFALRLFEPDEGVWRIWWSSDSAPGVLDEPVVGSFSDGHGVFRCVQRVRDADVDVQFEWLTADPANPRWLQSFSYDGGETWSLNWEMGFRRSGDTLARS